MEFLVAGPARPEKPVLNPSKYPVPTGRGYSIYGEQPGWIYNPWEDRYIPDRKMQGQYAIDSGAADKPKTQPGLGATIGTGAAVVGTGALIGQYGRDGGQWLGEQMFSTQTPVVPTPPKPPALALDPVAPVAPVAHPAAPPSSGGMIGPGSGIETSASGVLTIPRGTEVPPGYTAVGTANGGASEIVIPVDQVGADGSVNLGNIGLGVLGAVQLYGGYQAYQQGDFVGAGMGAVGGGTAIAAAAGSTTALDALPVVGAVTGVYTGYKTAEMVGDAPAGGQRNSSATIGGASAGAGIGAGIGSVVPVVGTVAGAIVGGIIGAAAGFASSFFGSSKDKYQMMRDQGRGFLKEHGILDENYLGTLADGSKFDFGKDGKGQVKLDYDDPTTGESIAFADVLAGAEGFSGNAREGMANLYAGAALSNAGGDAKKVKENFTHFAQQRGLNADAVQNELNRQLAADLISRDEFDAISATVPRYLGAPKTVKPGDPPIAAPEQAPEQAPGGAPVAQPPGSGSNGMIAPPPTPIVNAPSQPAPMAGLHEKGAGVAPVSGGMIGTAGGSYGTPYSGPIPTPQTFEQKVQQKYGGLMAPPPVQIRR